MKILIVGGGLQGLSCGCSLYKHHDVSIVASDLMSRKSRFFKKVYTDYKVDESLYELLEKEHFDVILPISDFTVPVISKNKKTIEDRFGIKCAVPDYEQVYIVEDKSRFMSFCEENDIPHPKTIHLTDNNLQAAATQVGFPALIKPDHSVGARGITRVDTLDALQAKFPMVSSAYGNCALQELIENKEYYYNVMLYRTASGQFPAYAMEKIVRMYPVDAGSSSCSISVENGVLLEICKDCLDKLKWVGMADFDVLQRLDNGEYKIIEINARVPASLKAAAISGVNFPEIITFDAMGITIPECSYTPGRVLRYLGIDILWLIKSPSRFQSNPCWFNLLGKDIFYQDLYKQDPSTWWTWLVEGLSKVTKRNKQLRHG